MYISSGGTASIAFNPWQGAISSASGAVVTYLVRDANIYYGNKAQGIISKCNTINDLSVSSGNSIFIYSGGVADNVSVNSGGSMYISSGGTANIVFNPWQGVINSASGAVVTYLARDANIYYGGTVKGVISKCNNVSNSTISSGISAIIYSRGIADNTIVNYGGRMYISSGGVHRGSLQIKSGAVVSAFYGAKIDFTLTDRTVTDGALINDLSLISGTPIFTITVAGNQESGIYKLAEGAKNFNAVISIGDGKVVYGSVEVNGVALEYKGGSYFLAENNGELTLTVRAQNTSPEPDITESFEWAGNISTDYMVKYSSQGGILNLPITGNGFTIYGASGGTVDVFDQESNAAVLQNQQIDSITEKSPQTVKANEDGLFDLFFARGNGTWDYGYAASHQGIKDGWSGTSDSVSIYAKNKLEDFFIGSSDANILVLTDDANGDALFVDDIYSALPDELPAQARIAAIDEIRAGAGDDVVDLTSQRFVYVGDGLIVYGGSGDDTIWATSGDNHLFGDAGNDRIVGGSDNDIIVGGAGNDRMHGGGGSDTFCFGENCGVDTVEQLADGEVILWFETGSEDFWNAETMTYSDGNNRVKVTGVSADNVTLKFGEIETAIAGAFDSFASEKIFEDQTKALLA